MIQKIQHISHIAISILEKNKNIKTHNCTKLFLDDSFYKILFPKPKGYIDQSYHNWDLYQRTNNSSKGFSGIDTED